MTLRRPIVRVGGGNQQLPQGDSIAGVAVSVPVMLASGVAFKVQLTTDYRLGVMLVGGTLAYVPASLA